MVYAYHDQVIYERYKRAIVSSMIPKFRIV